MAGPKMIASRCPSCGADLPVVPGLVQVTCRYCQNVIQIEHKKAPPHIQPFGSPGAFPSRTLYVDPDAVKAATTAGKTAGIMILIGVLLPILLPILIFAVPAGMKSCKTSMHPFPAACGINEELTLSGNYEGTGPLITSAGVNCKIHIKDAKLKASTLVKTTTFNMEITLENVTLDTTDTLVKTESNTKLHLHNSTLTTQGTTGIESSSNLEIELDNSTIESKTGTAVKTGYNFKLHGTAGKLRGKKFAIDAQGADMDLKKASEITSSEGIAIKTTSSLKIDAEGGKIDGAETGILATSGANITATGLTITSKGNAISATSGLHLDMTDGTVSSTTETAIDTDTGGELTLANSKVLGVNVAFASKGNCKVRATKKSRIAATNGYGLLTASNCDVTLNDASIEGTTRGMKATTNTKIKFGQGGRIAGKMGALSTEDNTDVDGTGGVLDGGSGPGFQAKWNAKFVFESGSIKGTPALLFDRKPSTLSLTGTQVTGEQKVTNGR